MFLCFRIAYVQYRTVQQARKAIDSKNGKKMGDDALFIQYTSNRKNHIYEDTKRCQTLVITNLALETTEEDLEELFDNLAIIHMIDTKKHRFVF